MTKAHDEMTTAASSNSSRWAVWVACGACSWAFLFAALSFYWAPGATDPKADFIELMDGSMAYLEAGLPL